MKHASIAGFSAGLAMMIGGALGAVTDINGHSAAIPEARADSSNPMIGGQAMLPDRDLMDNIASSPEHAKLVAALKDSGVARALKSNGEFTLFAPTDAAFTNDGSAQSRATLARRISYLVVPGKYDSQALLARINEGGGEARLRTAEGGVLIARLNGPTNIMLMDERGHMANIAIYDIHDRNGVIQVIDHMMAPSGPSRQVASN